MTSQIHPAGSLLGIEGRRPSHMDVVAELVLPFVIALLDQVAERVRSTSRRRRVASELVGIRTHVFSSVRYSTVTDLARLRGLSTSYPRACATPAANTCSGIVDSNGWKSVDTAGISIRWSA